MALENNLNNEIVLWIYCDFENSFKMVFIAFEILLKIQLKNRGTDKTHFKRLLRCQTTFFQRSALSFFQRFKNKIALPEKVLQYIFYHTIVVLNTLKNNYLRCSKQCTGHLSFLAIVFSVIWWIVFRGIFFVSRLKSKVFINFSNSHPRMNNFIFPSIF